LPEAVTRLAEAEDGLVLVAGPSGGGKTSTIAAMVHHVNRSTARHVITLEDPIEYLHRDLTGSITQRELGTDTGDAAAGIQAALRQDPDVLVIGELREPAAVDRALRAAESSRLVMATVAAPDAVAAVLQLVATLPPDEREVGRMRLAAVLRGVIAQRLVPKQGGEGREPVVEWLEISEGFRTAIMAGAEPAALRKAMDKAVKEGRAETFASLADAN
jgi:twitching motility protein PilT